MKKTVCLAAAAAVAVLLSASAACAQNTGQNTPPRTFRALAPDTQLKTATLSAPARKKVFETVWSRVNERYYDPTFGGINWKAVRTRYAPRALAPQADAAFYQLMQQMLDELKRSHFAIIPPGAYVAEDGVETKGTNKTVAGGATGERNGTVGLVIQLVENKPTITRVEKSGAAQAAGLRPGYVVTHLQNKSLDVVIEKIRKSASAPHEVPLLVRQALEVALHGAVGSDVVLGYRDENDQAKTITLKRGSLPGTPSRFGELPTIYVQTESQTLPGNIGYVRFNIYLMPVLEPVRAAIAQMQKDGASGIIVDLRGNPGGLGILAPTIAASFYDKKTDLGVMALRQGFLRFPVFPAPNPYRGPLVILTDSGSASTSEIFAGSLQEGKRAVVIGEKTAGKVMPSVIETLPGTRARLQFAFADFKTPKGVLIEGRGVLPDFPIMLTRQSLLASDDPVLAAAVSYIQGLPQNQVPTAQKEKP